MVGNLILDRLCPNFLFGHVRSRSLNGLIYKDIKAAMNTHEPIQVPIGGVNLIDFEDGGHHIWLGYFVAHFVYCFNITFPSPLFVPHENPDSVWNGYHDRLIDFQPGECVHEQDVSGTPIVDQDRSNSIIGYLDFSDRGIVIWVDKFVCFIVSEGNQNTVLAGDLHDVFDHVSVFPARYLSSVPDVASSATCFITCGRSPKNDMDNVHGLPGIGLVTRPPSVYPVPVARFGPATICNLSFWGQHPYENCSTYFSSHGYGLSRSVGGPGVVPFRRSGSARAQSWPPEECIDGTFI
ncbi:hypothetical protein TIFTF001_017338 [Ficus carica]|uniref:Uncharacterized protein n=1 Tax=Ficus carica TaxID=3494 RepID=A0AA88A9C8_FICCA|nr:hypothetical protein TIFTF001_017338 [Ficus carica]